jgi:diguanylate cyclase (GGDEF)-like protein/PAS domain S-box-containing protein
MVCKAKDAQLDGNGQTLVEKASWEQYAQLLHETALTLLEKQELTTLLKTLIERLRHLTGASNGFIALLAYGSERLLVQTETGYSLEQRLFEIVPGKGLIGKVWQSGQPLLIKDYRTWCERLNEPILEPVRAVVGMPIWFEGQVIGVIGLFQLEAERTFSERELVLLRYFAILVSLALDNTRLYHLAGRRLSELHTVQYVAQAVNSALPLEEVFKTIISEINRGFSYERISIYLRFGALLIPKAQFGLNQLLPTIQLNQGITGRAVQSRQAIFVQDVRQDKDYIAIEPDIQQLMVVPLLSRRNQVLGALVVGSTGEPELSEEDLTLLQVLANQISVAVENAYLFTKLRQSEKRYQQIVNTIKEILFQTDIEGKWTFLNTAWEEVLGYNVEETLGTYLADYLYPEDFEVFWQRFKKFLYNEKGQEFWRYQGRFITKDGSLRWLETSFRRTRNSDGKVIGTSGTINDITGRKQTEFLEKNQRQILEMIATKQPLSQILRQVAQLIEDSRRGELYTLMLLGYRKPVNLATLAMSESSLRVASPYLNREIDYEEAYQGVFLISTESIQDLSWDSYQELVRERGLQPCWSVPIVSSKQQLLGLFTAYYTAAGIPDREDLKLIELASSLAAIAIEQEKLSVELIRQAYHDALTGLANRQLLEEFLEQRLSQSTPTTKFALLFVDLDRFKIINDTLGHAYGDKLLQEVGWRLQSNLHPTNLVARLGGDEFVVVLGEIDSDEQVPQFAQRLLEVLQVPFEIKGRELEISASIGISLYPDDGENFKQLLTRADKAMYWAKKQGRNNYLFFGTPMEKATSPSLELEGQLRRAVERHQLVLYYQPQLDLATGKIVAAEALLRWNHPQFGLISPEKFIPLAEENGLIVPIGNWALEEACRQNKSWQQAGYPPLKIVVNVSALQFNREDFVEVVTSALSQNGLEAACLELEITESVLMQSMRQTVQKLEALKAQGVKLAIDDFGTGYSSLSYLQELPVDTLKIDRSFVWSIDRKDKDKKLTSNRAIIKAITTLAHSLEMQVVAEGVETDSQLEFLQELGCERIQGYFYSHPLSATEFTQLLAKNNI